MRTLWYFVGSILAFLIVVTRSFNLEPRIATIKTGGSGSYFGYSVAEHIILPVAGSRFARGPDPRILVGAPRAQSRQSGTNHSGVIFSCPLTNYESDCEELSLDDTHPVSDDELKDDQWLGVTVKSQGPGGFVMACAHRYVKKGANYRWGNGICYSLTQELDQDNVFDPCWDRPVQKAHEQYGYCQAGTSGTITDDAVIVIGTPGPYTWRGTVFTNSIAQGIRDDISWYMGPVLDHVAPVDKYSYLGMAVTSGRFFKNEMSYVAGAPRANNVGQVVFFTKLKGNTTLHVQLVLTGEVFASSFGYEVATADLNNDGRPDLIVGAPFYYAKDEGGAIYIYMNTPQGINKKTIPTRITGAEESRFGFAIANCSDLNKDGYEDIAVGAPYEKTGRVYIFLGSEKGIVKEPAQIIKAEDLPTTIRTFGYSLSGGIDMDGNNYPDLVVGAYENDAVVMLRARPIIGITTSVEGEYQNIDPNAKGCPDDKNSQSVCFSFRTCFTITSSEALESGSKLELNYTIEAETFLGKKISRVIFKNANKPDTKHIVHQRINWPASSINRKRCDKEIVYLTKNNRDILNPIKFKLTYALVQETPSLPTRRTGPLPNIDRYPILNQQEATKIFEATFEKDCEGEICESDLHTKAALELPDNELVLGDVDEIRLSISVINKNESAYEAAVYVFYPPSLAYIGHGATEHPCILRNTTVVYCRLDNPFKKMPAPTVIILRFSPAKVEPTETTLHMTVKTNSTSQERNRTKDPHIHLYARVVRRAEVVIQGHSEPDQVSYSGEIVGESAMTREDQIGTPLNHTYQITNRGPSSVGLVNVTIDWPYELENHQAHGKWVLYLLDAQVKNAYGSCYVKPEHLNPLNLTLNAPQDARRGGELYKTIRDDLEAAKFGGRTTDERVDESSSSEHSSSRKETSRTITTEYKETKRTRTYHYEETRKKRDIPSENKKIGGRRVILDCKGTAKCFQFHCLIKNLHRNDSAVVKIRARLWNSTFLSEYPDVENVHIYSHASLKIESVLEIKQGKDDDHHFAKTEAIPDIPYSQKPQVIPIWVYIVAVAVGLILLVGLILCLWMVGFFKRKKPDELMKGTVEKQNSHDY